MPNKRMAPAKGHPKKMPPKGMHDMGGGHMMKDADMETMHDGKKIAPKKKQ